MTGVLTDVRLGDRHATFRVLGTYGHLGVRRPQDLAAALAVVEAVTGDVDATCSRFRDDSDLSRVNRDPGRWVDVHPLLVEAVRVALDAAATTDGLVHPLLGRPLVTLGYDRDFARLVPRDDEPSAPRAPSLDAWRGIELGQASLRIPADAALDLGATAKAWASDLTAHGIAKHGIDAVVSLGGDIRVAGSADRAWQVEITEAPATVVEIDDGGLATSSTRVRRWRRGATTYHHLLDPRTGLPADGCWTTVTATGPTSVAANTASTAAVVLGADAPSWLEARGVDARLVGADGRVVTTGRWPAEMRAA